MDHQNQEGMLNIPRNDDSACGSLNLLSMRKIISAFFDHNVSEYKVLEGTKFTTLDMSG